MRRVASVSFGKDSLATLLLLLEKKMPLDEVIFYNSEMEFDCIYHIRDRIKPVLEQRGIRFTEVKPGVPFLYNTINEQIQKAPREDLQRRRPQQKGKIRPSPEEKKK